MSKRGLEEVHSISSDTRNVLSRYDRYPVVQTWRQEYGRLWNTRVRVAASAPFTCGFLASCSTWTVTFSPFLCCVSCVLLGVSKPAAVLVCLSGMNGSTLWSSPLPEEARDITCLDLMPGSMAETICLVTGTHKMFRAFNATSGKDHSTEVSVPVSC